MNVALVLDADQASRRRTVAALRYGGFDAACTGSVAVARRLLRRGRIVALIVDPGAGDAAPGIVEELRAITDAPIVVVSVDGEQSRKVAVLDAGADDYVTSPFDPEELLARVRAVVRRVPRLEDAHPVVTADFTMDLADRRLLRTDGRDVTLSPTEWRLVDVLVQHAGHLVSREDLLASVWGPSAMDKTQYLRVHMASIRR